MSGVHQALLLSPSGDLTIGTVPTPSPSHGEVLIAPLLVGVCGTDLDLARRTRPDFAAILGHEGVARVVGTGADVHTLRTCDLVVFNPVNPRNPDQILGHSVDGLLQQYRLVTKAELEWGLAVPLAPAVTDQLGVLVEPLATVIYGHQLVKAVSRHQSVAIVGAGSIGLLNAVHATLIGTARVILIDPDAGKLDWAVRLGIVRAEDALDSAHDLTDGVLRRTAGRGVDAVYLCTPRSAASEGLRQALGYLAPGGCIDLVAGFGDTETMVELPDVPLNAVRRANTCGFPLQGTHRKVVDRSGKDLYLTGHRGTSAGHMAEATGHLERNAAAYGKLITHRVGFREAAVAIRSMATGDGQWRPGHVRAKVVVDLTGAEAPFSPVLSSRPESRGSDTPCAGRRSR